MFEGWTHNMRASAADAHVPNQLFPPTPGEEEARAHTEHAATTANAFGQAAAGRQRSIREWLQQTATPTRVVHTAVQRPVLPDMTDAVWVDGIPTWPDEANATSAGGSVGHPIIIYSDDEATFQPHCDQPLLPEAVIDAQLLLQPMRDAMAHTGGVDSAVREVVSHQIMEMSESLDYEACNDQVYERFRSESTRSFEARGAVMLGMHADYASALQARIQGPAQHRVLWHPHGQLYIKVLVLLQHSLRDMAMLRPEQQGGEKAFMTHNWGNLKK